MIKRFIFLLSFIFVSILSKAAIYYVSPNGNDNNNGTSVSSPWKTITKVNASSLVAGDKVLFQRGGTYRGKIQGRSNVTYGAYGTGNQPIIAGSRLVTNWTIHTGNIWKTTISAPITNLYCQDQLMTLARFPNTGWLRNNIGSTNQINSPQLTQPNGYWAGAQAVIRSTTWSYDVVTITNYITGTLTFPAFSAGYDLQDYEWGFYMQNKFTELDMEGEWFYDSNTSQLYFWAPNSINPNTLVVEALGGGGFGESGVQAYLTQGTKVIGLEFKHYGYAGVENTNSFNFIVDSCYMHDNYVGFRSYIASGIGGSTDNVIVTNCVINKNFESGIKSVGLGHRYENNLLKYNATIPGQGANGWGYITVDTYSNNTVVRRNKIIGSGYIGITIRGNSLVEQNFIDSSCTILNDGCGMGPDEADGAIFRDNIILRTIGNTGGSCAPDWSGCDPKGKGIYFGNLFVRNTLVENNTVAYCNGAGMWVDHTMGSTGNIIRNNTFFDNNLYQIGFSDFSNYTGPYAIPPYAVPSYNQTITENVFYSKNASQRTMYHINRWYSGIDFGTFTNNKHHNPWNSTSIEVLNFINSTNPTYTLSQWKAATNDEVGSTASTFNLTGTNGINDHILRYNEQLTTQAVSLPPGTWSDLDGNLYTNSITLDSFKSKVLYKTTSVNPNPNPSPTPSTNVSVVVQATAGTNSITFNWISYGSATGYSIHRKIKTGTSWGSAIATLGSTTTQYVDNTASPGVYYEYRLTRNSSLGTAYGYVASSIQLPTVDYRGKLMLIVDNTFITSLQSELTQLENDLLLDGWIVNRINVNRTSTPQSIRTSIQSYYNSDPTNVKAVFLFGQIPVYYSGNINPDGHSSIPWACDAYYGEMNSTWGTQTSLPSDVELMVGRVDLRLMSAFPTNETELLRNYLNKLHNYKIKQWTVVSRGLLMDNFSSWVSSPLAEGGYRNMAPLVGINNITTIPGYGGSFPNTVTNGYLWTWSGGGGTYNSADGIASTSTYVNTQHNGVFNMTFGSYFGNWAATIAVPNWSNGENNFLRAPLASGQALTNVWDAQPTWFFHHMGLGDPIGYSTLITQNNRTSTPLYMRQNNGWAGQGYTTIHLGLMGDPSLRMTYISPPSNLTIQNNGTSLLFTWSPSSESLILGYNLYKINNNDIVKINNNIITTTSFSYNTSPITGDRYMVKAVKSITNFSGNYNDLSLGSLALVPSPLSISLNIKVFLEGPYKSNNGSMTDSLRTKNILPLNQPYTSLGYTFIGGGNESIQLSSLNTTGNNALVDWIIIEIRNNVSPYNVLYSKACLLQRDGDVVDNNINSNISFPLSSGNYHISIKHRNHLGIMTSSPINLSSSPTNINFTSNTNTWGTNAQKTINNVKVMWAGDVSGDGVIKYVGSGNDRDIIINRLGGTNPTSTLIGYYNEDVNMDGIVKYTGGSNDRDIILLNLGGNNPTSTRIAQIP
jgi:hypothetical protein